ncbi:hypothetical protein J2X98_001294 [Pseudarthrobacter enclensis]|uniref:Uncharacterized protein n=1 Tax=Pseudarthrobacter enclensis TaxID=993070 RepID=A0ABT9RR59_9MICC|nr:hypothetical protein [Pseudarthrobacter enclensis]
MASSYRNRSHGRHPPVTNPLSSAPIYPSSPPDWRWMLPSSNTAATRSPPEVFGGGSANGTLSRQRHRSNPYLNWHNRTNTSAEACTLRHGGISVRHRDYSGDGAGRGRHECSGRPDHRGGMFIADALSTSSAAVLSGTAHSGPFELLATGLHFSVILGLIFAGNSLTRPDPDYREVLNLFRRNDTSGFNEAAPALPLLSCSFPAYWLGFGGVLLFVWRRHEAASGIGELSASLALLGAAGLALWMMLVALGKRFRHDAGSGVQEHEAALSANMLSRPGTRGPMEPYRRHVGIEYRTIRATIPLVELSATSKVLHFRFRFGRDSFWGHGTSAGNRYSRCSQHADCGRVRRRLWGLLFGIRAFRVRLAE